MQKKGNNDKNNFPDNDRTAAFVQPKKEFELPLVNKAVRRAFINIVGSPVAETLLYHLGNDYEIYLDSEQPVSLDEIEHGLQIMVGTSTPLLMKKIYHELEWVRKENNQGR